MRILFVALDIPYPPNRGQRLRNWAILRALAEEGHSVTLASLVDSGEPDSGALLRYCKAVRFVPVKAPRVPALLHRVAGFFSPLPYAAWRKSSPALRDIVSSLVSHGDFDLVIWDEVYNLVNLPSDLPVPVMLNAHDVVRVIWHRFSELERNPLKKAYARLEHRKLCRWEQQSEWHLSGILACSENDARAYRRMYPAVPVTVANNCLDLDRYQRKASDDGRTVLFVGGLNWLPNLDAVQFFADSVLPLLRRLQPDVRFVVAGNTGGKRLPGVEFTGEVDDMAAVIAKTSVCVVPLRIGSGTRLKILEAAAMRKPVVSTSIGAEGLHFDAGRDILIADHPAQIAWELSRLLSDDSLRSSIGNAAFERVAREYSVPALRASLRQALPEFAAKAAS